MSNKKHTHTHNTVGMGELYVVGLANFVSSTKSNVLVEYVIVVQAVAKSYWDFDRR